MGVSSYIPTNSVRAFPFLHSLSSIYSLQTFWTQPFWLAWDVTSLWFWFAFFWSWVMLSIFSCVCSVQFGCSVVSNSLRPCELNESPQALLSMGFSKQEYWRVAIPFSRGSSWPRDHTQVSCTADKFFTLWASWPKSEYNMIRENMEITKDPQTP